MLRKDLDQLVQTAVNKQIPAEEIIYTNHLDYIETVYFIKHLTSALIDVESERLILP